MYVQKGNEKLKIKAELMSHLKERGEFYFDFIIRNWDIRSRCKGDKELSKSYEALISNYAKEYDSAVNLVASALSLVVRTEKHLIVDDFRKNIHILDNTASLIEYFSTKKYPAWAKRSKNAQISDLFKLKHEEITEEEWEKALNLIKKSLDSSLNPVIYNIANKQELITVQSEESKDEESNDEESFNDEESNDSSSYSEIEEKSDRKKVKSSKFITVHRTKKKGNVADQSEAHSSDDNENLVKSGRKKSKAKPKPKPKRKQAAKVDTDKVTGKKRKRIIEGTGDVIGEGEYN